LAGVFQTVTKDATVAYRHRIEATSGTVAIDTRRTSGTNDTYYLHRDHLGSPELISKAAGASVVKLSFSAYGERRDTDRAASVTRSGHRRGGSKTLAELGVRLRTSEA
jgi:hypothetical protein